MDLRKVKDEAAKAFSKGRFAKAADLYQQYCQGDPKDLQARLRMGDAWAKAGEKDKAIASYKAAAEGFARDGFLPRAIAASKLILELDPKHTGIQQMLAGLYAAKAGGPGSPKPANRPSFEAPRRSPGPSAPAQPGDWSTRSDAIELPEESASTAAASPLAMGGELELDLAGKSSQDKPLELDLGAQPLDHSSELPPELQLQPASAAPVEAPDIELEVELEASGPAPLVEAEAIPVETLDVEVVDLDEPIALDKPKAKADDVPVPLPSPSTATAFSPPGLRPKKLAPETPAVTASPTAVQRPVTPVEQDPSRPGSPFASSDDHSTVQFRPSGRIWIPGSGGPSPSAPSFESEPPPPSRGLGDLADSLSRLSRFDELELDGPSLTDIRPAAPVQAGFDRRVPRDEAPPPPRGEPSERNTVADVAPIVLSGSVGSFTELELDGDSLLHAVSMAAQAGAAERAQRGEASDDDVESLRGGEELTHVDAEQQQDELPKIPLFSDLPPDAFIALFERCPLLRPANGERIIEQGSLGDSFFVICEGAVRVVREDGGQRRELAVLKDGAFFGEMALLSGAARTASVESADDDTQLLEISGAILKELSAMYPQVARALKKFMRQRLLSNVMGSSPLFAPFGKKERRALVEKFRSREVKKGDAIIREGDRSDGLYIVLSGEVAVRKGGQELARLKEGELFGEMSLLQKTAATATVSAAKNTTVLRLPRDDFDRLISTNPQVLTLVAELTANRARANQALLQPADDDGGEDIMF